MEDDRTSQEVEKDRADKFRNDYNRAADETASDLKDEQHHQDERLDQLEKN